MFDLGVESDSVQAGCFISDTVFAGCATSDEEVVLMNFKTEQRCVKFKQQEKPVKVHKSVYK